LGERSYSSYSFLTSAVDGGEWSASSPSHAIPLGKGPSVPIGQEAGWAPEPVWTQKARGKILLPLLGIEPRWPDRPVRSQTLLTELPRLRSRCRTEMILQWMLDKQRSLCLTTAENNSIFMKGNEIIMNMQQGYHCLRIFHFKKKKNTAQRGNF
jgi:hypothetical protein